MKRRHVPAKLGSIAVLALTFQTGCAGWSVHPETVVHRSPKTSAATLVVGEITHPRDLTVSAPFYVAMQREIPLQLEGAHVSAKTVSERDLGVKGVTGAAFALRYRVVEDHVRIVNSGAACTVTLTITGSFTLVPFFFIGLCTRTAEHDLTIEARVFDVSRTAVQRIQDSSSNEMLNVYDTSSLPPILRKEYHVAVDVEGRAFLPATDEVLEISKKEAGEAVRQLLDRSLDDVARALQ